MPQFLVESYQPAGAPAPPPAAVRVLHSIFVPDDESCLQLISAPSLEALREALEAAAFRFERIVEAVEQTEGET